MRLSNKHRGFTLPAVLVVVGALLILAVGALLVVGIERDTARSFVDRQRAELAARAGLEDIRGILTAETTNDDFVVLQSTLAAPITPGGDPAPHLFIGRGTSEVSNQVFKYRYIPLFSTTTRPADAPFAAPELEPLTGANASQRIEFTTLPYHDKVRAAWLPVQDENGRTVARYAYWVEDLQSRVDPAIAGNDKGPGGTHARAAWPFPAPGLNDQAEADDEPALDQIALFALDPAATDAAQGDLGKTLLKNRKLLVSPDSQLAAAGIQPPLVRLTSASAAGFAGDLTDPKARAVERGLATGIRPYLEQPVVPYAAGIDPAAAGQPRLNLNKLLAADRASAVDEMAAHIRKALPKFEERKGGFPDDYLKTLAANALDYADADNDATVGTGYRGIDAAPLLSEIALQINYVGISNLNNRKIMTFRFKLFAELFNPTNKPTSGKARVSYEVDLRMDGIGSGTGDMPFDDPSLLSNPLRSTHDLTLIEGRYWSREVSVTLEPNQYRFYPFADITYRMDVGPSSVFIPGSTLFSLNEPRGSSGLSLLWNGTESDRASNIVRQEGLVAASGNNSGNGFRVGTAETITKAALPGHVYDNFWPSMYYNMGDPRITYYLREAPLAEIAYPQNISPNRRNIRQNISSRDFKVYARQLPSEWPDGGHNVAVGNWTTGTNDATEPTAPQFNFAYSTSMKDSAPHVISNRGYFLSATELGRVFDPIMFKPLLSSSSATDNLLNGIIPASECWPDATTGQGSKHYGGGNTLRIGRPEHPVATPVTAAAFGMNAARLLDLFHCGMSRSTDDKEREGSLVGIHGQMNLNTAGREAIRTAVAGKMMMDPLLSRQSSTAHLGSPTMAPPVIELTLPDPAEPARVIADRIAEAVIANRPYASAADVVDARDKNLKPVFGNREQFAQNKTIEWTDAAAEELFARLYESTTIRSRNFRIWVIGQAVEPTTGTNADMKVLAEVRRNFTVFAEPGERLADGTVNSAKFKTKVISTNDF
jgi:type II secretory pathway pseudopilin PulG